MARRERLKLVPPLDGHLKRPTGSDRARPRRRDRGASTDHLEHEASCDPAWHDRFVSVIRRAGGLSLLIAAACSPIPADVVAPKPVPLFSAEVFFAGRTEGHGTLNVIFSRPRQVTVHGSGHLSGDGELVLDQVVEEDGSSAKRREWRISRTTTGRYAGTLSDASSPVQGDVTGNRLHLHFMMKGGLDTDQWLSLSPDGRVADNVMLVRKFGIRIATLHEIIRKVD